MKIYYIGRTIQEIQFNDIGTLVNFLETETYLTKEEIEKRKVHETSHFEKAIELGYIPKPSIEWDPYLKDIKEIFVDVQNVHPIDSIKIALAPKIPSKGDLGRVIKAQKRIQERRLTA